MTLRNTSERALRVDVDARRLSLIVVAPTGQETRCRLPNDFGVGDPAPGAAVRLGPSEAVTRTVDPWLYCHGRDLARILVAGARLVPLYHLGRPAAGSRRAPPEDEATDVVRGEGWVLGDSDAFPRPPDEDEPASGPRLELVRGADARNERAVVVTVRFRNPTGRALRMFIRRALLSFDVEGVDGRVVRCEPEDRETHPTRGSFTRIPAKSKVSLPVRLVELCPPWTFAERGEYVVRARYESKASGDPLGISAFRGVLVAPTPTLVRVRHSVPVVKNHVVPQKPQGAPLKPGTPPPKAPPRAAPKPPPRPAPKPPPRPPVPRRK